MSLNVAGPTMGVTSSGTELKTIKFQEYLKQARELERKPEIGKTYDWYFIVPLKGAGRQIAKLIPVKPGDIPNNSAMYVDLITIYFSKDSFLTTQGVTLIKDKGFFTSERLEDTSAYEVKFEGEDFWFELIIHSNDRKLAKEIHTAIAEKLTLGIAPKEVLDWLIKESSFSKRNGEGNPEFEKSSLITVLGYPASSADREAPSLD